MPGQLYFAHYLMASEIQGAKFVKEYDFGPRGCGYLFRSGDRNVLIAWANGLSGIDGVLTTGASTIEIADWTGRRASIEAAGRPIAARLSVRPAFYAWKGPDPSSILSFERDPTLKVATDRDRVLYSGTANTVTITANQNARKAMNLDIDAGPGVVVSPASITLKPGESRDVTVTIPPDLAATRVTIDIRQTDGKALGGWTSYEYNIKPSVSVSIDQVPLVNRLGSSERPAWKVIVSNGGAQPTSVMLSLDSLATNGPVPDHSVATVRLAKGQSKVLTFPLSSTPSYSRVYDLNYIAQVAGRNVIAGSATHGFLGIAHLAKPFRIDADLSKWSSFRPAAVTGDENYFRFRNDGVPWGGPADLSAKLYFAWDKDALYVAADVSDDIHVNTKDPHDSYIWDGDSLEFALQPVTSDGYGPIVKSIFALASGEPAVMFSPSSPGCKPSAATVKVRRVTGHTLYEAQLPWKAIYPDVAEVHVGSCFRVAALLNEDDHGAREAYMTWFGLLCWPTLGAGEFTDMVLCN